MRSHPESSDVAAHHVWRRFWLLLGAFFVASVFAGLIPTPGGWSDTRSQWAAPCAIALTAVIFLLTAQWEYRRRGLLSRLQVWILSALFTAVLILISFSLWESVAFLRSVSDDGEQAAVHPPNQALEATAAAPGIMIVTDNRTASASAPPVPSGCASADR
jgi:lysylphosphatidylglycerol synthetase-like protein (DUF2156 family)